MGAASEDVRSRCGLIIHGRHVDPVTLRPALAPRNAVATPELRLERTSRMASRDPADFVLPDAGSRAVGCRISGRPD